MADFAMQVMTKRTELVTGFEMKRMEISTQIMDQEDALEMILVTEQQPMVEEAFAECYEEVKAEI
jgi:recombinational DNA repair ATPase RecF